MKGNEDEGGSKSKLLGLLFFFPQRCRPRALVKSFRLLLHRSLSLERAATPTLSPHSLWVVLHLAFLGGKLAGRERGRFCLSPFN